MASRVRLRKTASAVPSDPRDWNGLLRGERVRPSTCVGKWTSLLFGCSQRCDGRWNRIVMVEAGMELLSWPPFPSRPRASVVVVHLQRLTLGKESP